MNSKKYAEYLKNDRVYVIKFNSHHCEGQIIVDTKYYLDNIKKFNKVLKDVYVYSFEEKEKEDD